MFWRLDYPSGAGCLMYSAILSIDTKPYLSMIDWRISLLYDRLFSAVKSCGIEASREGICDLIHKGKNFRVMHCV